MRLPGSSKSKDGVGSALAKILSPRSKSALTKILSPRSKPKTPSDSPLLDGGGMEIPGSSQQREATTPGNEGGRPSTDDDAVSSVKIMHDVEEGGRSGYNLAPDYRRGKETLSPSTTPAGGGEVEGGEIEAIYREGKLGHKFLFVCCDSKRAVVVLTSVMLFLNAFMFASALIEYRGQEREGFASAMVMQGCGMFITFCVLLGAFWYSIHVVAVGLLYTAYQLMIGIIRITRYDWHGGNGESGKLVVILPFVVNSLIFYAEAVFISEVSDGIISADTYKQRERYSCCCWF
jgi:hypothetical protein